MPDGGRMGVSAEAPRDGVNTVTTRCRLLCHDLDCGAEYVGDDLACYRNSSISCTRFQLTACSRGPSAAAGLRLASLRPFIEIL